MSQEISYSELSEMIHGQYDHVFFLSGKTFDLGDFENKLSLVDIPYTRFSDFSENPTLEDLIKAKNAFTESKSTCIVAIGGGTAIDLAKLVKHYAYTPFNGRELQPPKPLFGQPVDLIAVPSTFGTGSEVTHFAVVYINGKKFSVAHELILPDAYILDGTLATTLPASVKGAAILDALSQAIESYWSVAATDESKQYARAAINLIIDNIDNYVKSESDACAAIVRASNLAGKAINITKTTAAHAVSYTLTAKYGISHGHAVALCIQNMFALHSSKVHHAEYESLHKTMNEIYSLMRVNDAKGAGRLFSNYMVMFGLSPELNTCVDKVDLNLISENVNFERLSNHPIAMTSEDIKSLFKSRKIS